jgi:hypothetical protein
VTFDRRTTLQFDETKRPAMTYQEDCTSLYPGPEMLARAGVGHFDPDDPKGARSDFVLSRNPTPNQLRADVSIGSHPMQIKLARLMQLPPPVGKLTPEQRVSLNMPGHPRLTFLRLVWEARGELWVPKAWKRALRTESNGQVVGGLAPQIQFRSDPQAGVAMAPGLLSGDEALPAPSRRRRTGDAT